ncbi:hypothetical protein [Leisingera sp. JC11]|uniref:hypothetical protein n=1 Tax=Leisingera sp. JC11 TaxID=3042469 RepID=UPI0034569E76
MTFAAGAFSRITHAMQNKGLTALASDIGLALVAVQAAAPESNVPGFPTMDAREGIDELAYFGNLTSVRFLNCSTFKMLRWSKAT